MEDKLKNKIIAIIFGECIDKAPTGVAENICDRVGKVLDKNSKEIERLISELENIRKEISLEGLEEILEQYQN